MFASQYQQEIGRNTTNDNRIEIWYLYFFNMLFVYYRCCKAIYM